MLSVIFFLLVFILGSILIVGLIIELIRYMKDPKAWMKEHNGNDESTK